MSNKKITFVIILVLGLIISFGAGFDLGKKSSSIGIFSDNQPDSLGKKLNIDLLWQALGIIENKYVNKNNINYDELIYGAISGMIKGLGDPYSVFLKPEDSKIFLEDVSGQFEGIGTEIGIKNGQLKVIAPLEGTPAQKAGLRPGDNILKIDDNLTADLTIEEAVKLIRGPKGSKVNLTITRDSLDETKELSIIRDVIDIPSLKWEKREDGISYIKLYSFSEKASDDFKKTVKNILNSDSSKIILDLRGNPGGFLEISVDIASWFLPKGKVVAREIFADGSEELYKTRDLGALKDFPLVILIDRGSASASEILAGALRDLRGVRLIGETTFGKGSVQELEKLNGGASLKVTVAKWLTPSGKSINEEGLEPDVKVELTEEDYNNNKDPQLEKAVELLLISM